MENNTENRQPDEGPIDWGALLRRKDRPLPKRGCSIGFYVFLVLLFVFLGFMFVKYKSL